MFKKKIPLAIAFITGTIYIVSKFVPNLPIAHEYPMSQVREDFAVWFDIIAAFAFILGGGNLLFRHLSKMSKRSQGWGYSVICVISFIAMLVIGLFKIGNPDGWSGDITNPDSPFGYMYNYVFAPLSSTMFSLLAFFIASAAFRAFRAKNKEATILLVSAFIILLGRTFVGTMATEWLPEWLDFLKIPNLFNWLLNVPNTAGQRAIMIGIALGVVSTSLKLILGVESSYLGKEE